MKWISLVLFFLVACASQNLEPVVAPVSQVIYESPECSGTKFVGEGCWKNCDCKVPSECIRNVCQLVKQEDGSLCIDSKQCLSGYCKDDGRCGGPDGPSGIYRCKRECKSDVDGSTKPCYTVCRYG